METHPDRWIVSTEDKKYLEIMAGAFRDFHIEYIDLIYWENLLDKP